MKAFYESTARPKPRYQANQFFNWVKPQLFDGNRTKSHMRASKARSKDGSMGNSCKFLGIYCSTATNSQYGSAAQSTKNDLHKLTRFTNFKGTLGPAKFMHKRVKSTNPRNFMNNTQIDSQNSQNKIDIKINEVKNDQPVDDYNVQSLERLEEGKIPSNVDKSSYEM